MRVEEIHGVAEEGTTEPIRCRLSDGHDAFVKYPNNRCGTPVLIKPPIAPFALIFIDKISSTPSSDAVITIAPAPSPNRIDVPLSVQSVIFELLSDATIKIVLYIPAPIKPLATCIAYISPVQAAVKSNAGT